MSFVRKSASTNFALPSNFAPNLGNVRRSRHRTRRQLEKTFDTVRCSPDKKRFAGQGMKPDISPSLTSRRNSKQGTKQFQRQDSLIFQANRAPSCSSFASTCVRNGLTLTPR